MEKKIEETPEETLERIMQQWAEHSQIMPYKSIIQLLNLQGAVRTKETIISIAKIYHAERLKQSLPSEQEIIDIALKTEYAYGESRYLFIKGFKSAIELLTKQI